MRDDERRALQEVWEEYVYLLGLLRQLPNPHEPAANNLEATYLLRLYARFEELLRRRLSLPTDDESTLASLIQKLTGENVGYDPANGGDAISWWRLFRRDRNLIAHGRGLVPAIGLSITRTLMEVYLSSLKD